MRKKTPWPAGKPIPNFKSLAEEEAFWLSHEFEDGPPSDWEELTYEPRGQHLLDLDEETKLKALREALIKGEKSPIAKDYSLERLLAPDRKHTK